MLLLPALFLFCNFIKAQSWNELGGLDGLAANERIWSVCSDTSGNIYAAGVFTNSSGKYYVAKYDGSAWGELGGLNGLAASYRITSVCSDASGNIYAAGGFQNSSGNYYVAKYNGSSWSELGGLNGLAANNGIASICSDASGNIYATGGFTNSSGKYYVAKYNGSSWSELGGLNGLSANLSIPSVCSDASGNIYAAGDFTNSSGNTYVAKYNGSAWSELGGLNGLAANDAIFTVCSDASGNIYAAGWFTNGPNEFSGNRYVAKYNGSSWSELGGLNGLAPNGEIRTICSDTSGNIYAAGSFINSSHKHYVAKYNGSSWSELGGLNGLAANSSINSVCSDPSGNIYAGGNFSNSSGKMYVAKYNGSSWHKLNGLAVYGTINSVCSDAYGNIYAAGWFTNSSGYNYVAQWTACNVVISPSGSVTFCPGENVLLTASPGTAYQWKKNGVSISGATLSSYSATAGGQYCCVVTTTGCGNIVSNNVIVTENTLPSAAITYTGSVTFCMGDTVVLTVPAGANKTYQWKKGGNDISGATNSFYAATTGGSYKVTVTNTVNGCSKTIATATVLTTNPQPSATITPQGPTTFCAGGSVLLEGNSGTGYTYQWKKGGNDITGATNKNYTATIAGTYKIKVTNSYGCSKLSTGVTVTVPCKLSESESAFDVKVYPNPSSGDFIFETENESTEKISVSVYDMVGKLLESGEMNNGRFILHSRLLSGSQLTPGVYAATITDGKNPDGSGQVKKVLRLIKTK